MCKTVPEYIEALQKRLRTCDPALVQDALSDAEEHLRNGIEEAKAANPEVKEGEAIVSLIERFGTPEEVAAAYRDAESGIRPSWFPTAPGRKTTWRRSFFGILSDSRAWGAFLYFLLTGLTGVFYGMWVLFGLSLSFFSLIFIIGVPLTGLFFLSLRGIALIEGQIVEALLGIRMPKRPLFIQDSLSWKAKFKALVTESHTWRILLYLVLQFPLGLTVFFLALTSFSLSMKCIVYPAWFWGLGRPLITLNTSAPFYPPVWSFPFVVAGGVVWLLTTLHLIKAMGKQQGLWAKKMLVRKMEE